MSTQGTPAQSSAPAVISQNFKRADRTQRSSKKSAVTLTRIKSQDNDGTNKAASRQQSGTMLRIEDSPSKNSAAPPIRQRRARNDDEDPRHEATLARSLELSNAGAVPVSVSEVHSACGPGGSNRRNQRAAASDAIR